MKKLRIMLAENNANDRKGFLDTAKNVDTIEVVSVTGTSRETVEAVSELAPHTLILDFGLKTHEDYAIVTLRALQKAQLKHIPFIIIPTFQPMGEVHKTAFECGADIILSRRMATSRRCQRLSISTTALPEPTRNARGSGA